MIRTYLDTGVIIAAWSAQEPRRSLARRIIADHGRTLVASDMLALELLPHPTFSRHEPEVRFMRGYLSRVESAPALRSIGVERALELGCEFGVSGGDALHISLALAAKVDQFITTENRTKPMFRVEGLDVIHLDDVGLGKPL